MVGEGVFPVGKWVERFLSHLQLSVQKPDLDFLHQLVDRHQRLVPWENLTKIIDTQETYDQPFLPPIELYIERMTAMGAGGTCWTLARGLHWLLQQLDYDVSYLYMDPGHLCLRVDLDQPYYVDVGYCAPLFRAYPLFESFETSNEREVFQYMVNGETIEVVRTPGPTKQLSPHPRSFEEFTEQFHKSNQWETSEVLKNILAYAYLDHKPASLRGFSVRRHTGMDMEEWTITLEEQAQWLTRVFGIHPELVQKAQAIWLQHREETNSVS